MIDWLFDTFLWTGALIVLVLLLRRPVARHFGPQVAYALWALPLARLVLPPLVLPASMAPAGAAPVAGGEPLVILLADAPQAATTTVFAWLPVLTFGLWLGGAVLLLAWRVRDYVIMRRVLLAEARPMGEAGRVRLVETPAVDSPVAFGVRDRVVALPPGFMVQPDRAARDLAIAHELAHHAGHDLLANLAAQPLLALHWFNPLAWWGWRAMRSDQEAACDARVVAGRERHERAAYAQVIAGFAAGPRLALAAPMASSMACPVLGEKSIVHRLRSLTMTDVSSTRRKLGLAAIGAGALLALPMTASISYAQAEMPDASAAAEARTVTRTVTRTVRSQSDVDPSGAPERQGRELIQHEGEDIAGLDEAAIERMMADIETSLEGIEDVDAIVEQAMEGSRAGMQLAMQQMPLVDAGCDNASEVVSHRQLVDGRRVMIICQRAAQLNARNGLREAQRAIRAAEGLPPETRERILEELEAEIESLGHDQAMAEMAAVALASLERMEKQATRFALMAPPAPPAAPAPPAPPVQVVLIRASVVAPAVEVPAVPTI